MSAKPTVLVTRRLPEAVTTRLHRDYDARTNDADQLIEPGRLPELARDFGAKALLPCPTDKLTSTVIDALPEAVRIISTFSVGHEHIDLAAAKAKGIVVTNTPDVLTDATA